MADVGAVTDNKHFWFKVQEDKPAGQTAGAYMAHNIDIGNLLNGSQEYKQA